MALQQDGSPDCLAIKAMLNQRARELHDRDVDGFMSHYGSDIVKFDLAPPLGLRGQDALDKSGVQAWFSSFEEPICLDTRDMEIAVDGELAFCHGLIRIRGARTGGSLTDVWARQTLCLRKFDCTWRIVHEHESVPFYMDGSFKAAVGLTP